MHPLLTHIVGARSDMDLVLKKLYDLKELVETFGDDARDRPRGLALLERKIVCTETTLFLLIILQGVSYSCYSSPTSEGAAPRRCEAPQPTYHNTSSCGAGGVHASAPSLVL